jgi:glycosyltransferase involved in cell wall biosynthesis
MKVLVQIPALNEEDSIARVISSIPRDIPNVTQVHVLVIDDGSTDGTVAASTNAGADFVVSLRKNAGLAKAFVLGQEFFLSKDYDVLVNTDGDNQYYQDRIPNLLAALEAADIVIGDRETRKLSHFHPMKKLLQFLGSSVMSVVSDAHVPDAASGFRAYTRRAVANLFVTGKFSYAMETLIQAGNKGFEIASIPTGAKPVNRPSRLFRSNFEHVRKSGYAILRGFLLYRPLSFFSIIGAVLMTIGLVPMVRFLILTASGTAGSHFQSLLLGSILILASTMSFVMGLLGEHSRHTRSILETELAARRITEHPRTEDILIACDAKLVYSKF